MGSSAYAQGTPSENCTTTVSGGSIANIQSAVSQATSGDTICIRAGTYTGDTLTINKAVTLRGFPGDQPPTLDAQYAYPSSNLVKECDDCRSTTYDPFVTISADNVTLLDINIANSQGRGLQLYRTGSSDPNWSLQNIAIIGVNVTGSLRDGIKLHDDGSGKKVYNVLIDQSRVENNVSFYRRHRSASSVDWQGGIAVRGGQKVTIQNSVIADNFGEGLIVDDLDFGSNDIVIKNNELYDNYALQLYLHGVQNFSVENNLIYASVNKSENYRGSNPAPCIVVTGTEGQFAGRVPTKDGTIKNNILTGCGTPLSFWGDIAPEDITIAQNTLFRPYSGGSSISNSNSDSTVRFENNLLHGGISPGASNSSNNRVISAESEAGFASTIPELRYGEVQAQWFTIGNYNGVGADATLFGDDPPSPTATPTPSQTCGSPGDIDCSGEVNIFDLSRLLGNFGATGANEADIDGSGEVNVFDLSILLRNFGS